MKQTNLVRSFSVVAGLVGLIAYGGIGRAQTTPTPEQFPEVEQPDTTPTPVQPPANGVEQPDTTPTPEQSPGVEQPDTIPTPEQPPTNGVEQPDTTPTPEQSPGIEQPDTTPTPVQPPANGVEQPDTTPTPTQPTPGVEQPDTTAPTNDLLENSENQPLTELLQQASVSGSFTTLARAVEAAEIGDALQANGEQYTILAPTDEAFAELPDGALEQLLQPENQGLLRQVLAYHVIPSELMSNDISTGRVETLGGGIAVQVAEDRIIVNDGSVIQADIQAANGVVHVINRVLIPSELRQQILELQ